MPASIRDASTVLPLRDGPNGLEVFMIKRSSRLGFLAGAHVFPGGAVDPEDSTDSMRCCVEGFDDACGCAALGLESAERVFGYYVAAVRELFEEAGVLLARPTCGAICGFDGSLDAELSRYRRALAKGEAGFWSMLVDLDLKIRADLLSYFAHWITPASERRRFDTRFFLTRMPPGQAARHDAVESTDGEWLRPADALARYAQGEIDLVVPTICALDRLALHAEADDALWACRALDVVDVVPKITKVDGRLAILYPGDPDYDGALGVSEPGRMLHRRVLREGRWERP